MELVYLWVEEYKNIKRQGFNFSPRFNCKYDEDTKELTIDENKDYVSIFPDNINVTAIVGENGSGKSSIISGISNESIIFKIDEKYYKRGFSSININTPFTIENNRTNTIAILEYTIYLDFDLIKINSLESYWDYSMQNICDRNLYHKIVNTTYVNDTIFNIHQFRNNFFNLITEYNGDFDSEIFIYKPKTIIISDYIHENSSKEERFKSINSLIKTVNKEEKYFSKEKLLLFIYNYLANHVQLMKTFPMIKTIEELVEIEDKILDEISSLKFKINIQNKDLYYKFFDDINHRESINLSEFNNIYQKHKSIFLDLHNIGYINVEFEDNQKRKYFSLSQGERKFFTESLMIYDAICKNDKDEILIVLDEPDISLHPDWQKKYINELCKLLLNFPKKNFHIILTSHSPFILSDLPKENVIFLEKYKEGDNEVKEGKQEVGNCKNVSSSLEIEQTFGANIHTLLSHGFFMQDGLMGEFAKSKIKSIIDYHNEVLKKEFEKEENKTLKLNEKETYEKNYKENFAQIQKIIGDDYLKQVVKNHIIEIEKILYDDFMIDEEINRLQKQINNLKELKSK